MFHFLRSLLLLLFFNPIPFMYLQIEDEKNRLSELRRIAQERAELEWIEKKRDLERRETEEKEIESKREMLEQLKKEQEEQAERERKVIAEQTERMRLQEELLKVSQFNSFRFFIII